MNPTNQEFKEGIVAIMNYAINHPNPTARILLAKRLCRGFGRMFMAPTETLEQLVAKFEQEFKDNLPKDNQGAVPAETNPIASNHVAFLKTFLQHRSGMINTLRELGIEIPD